MARYLYEHLCNAQALSAGLDCGGVINDRAERILRAWGIDASAHRPATITRELCDRTDAIFVMGPSYLHRLVWQYGDDLAGKAYLFADPFTRPESFANGEYKVIDPSYDDRPTSELTEQYAWMRERVVQIQSALMGRGLPLVPLSQYLSLCKSVDKWSH